MSPDDKAALVESFIDLGFTTGMCGDGANDCGALKAAHVGISLSEVEASIAAPFTSKIASVECVEKIILDGRASLATSFQSFKATAIFSMIQLSTSLVLIYFYSLMTDFQFLSVDIFCTLPFLFSIGYSRSNSRLTLKSPQGSLISFPVICSLIAHTLLTFSLQVIMAFVGTQCYDYWFEPLEMTYDERLQSFPTTAVYLTSLFHYLASGVILASYDPFLELFFLNWLLVLGTIFVIAMVFVATFVRLPWLDALLMMQPTDDWLYYRWLLISSGLYFIVLVIIEYLIAQPNLPKRIYRKMRPRSKLVGKVKTISEKERRVLFEEEVREYEKKWQHDRLAPEDPADEREDEVLLDPTQQLDTETNTGAGGSDSRVALSSVNREGGTKVVKAAELGKNTSAPKKSSIESSQRRRYSFSFVPDGEKPALVSPVGSTTPPINHKEPVSSKVMPYSPSNTSFSSLSIPAVGGDNDDVFTLSEHEKRRIYDAIPTSRKVFAKPFYALLATMDTVHSNASV